MMTLSIKAQCRYSYCGSTVAAHSLFTQFFKSDAPWNESGWKNAKFDQLLLAARSETDDAKRKQMYGDMQVIVAQQGRVGIPAFISFLDGYDKRLHCWDVIPTASSTAPTST